jgi:hypothetical protein
VTVPGNVNSEEVDGISELRVKQIIRPLLSVVPAGTARDNLLAQAKDLGLGIREEREQSLEGLIVKAMAAIERTAREQGADTYKKFRETGSLGARHVPRQQGAARGLPFRRETVGRRMKTILGYRSGRGGPKGNLAVYRYDEAQLRRIKHMYGVPLAEPRYENLVLCLPGKPRELGNSGDQVKTSVFSATLHPGFESAPAGNQKYGRLSIGCHWKLRGGNAGVK